MDRSAQNALDEGSAVLLLEDNEIDAEVLCRFARLAGQGDYTIREARTLKEAQASLATRRFDLIMLDLNLPDSEGRDTFDAIYAAEKLRTPIIVLTGRGNEEMGAHLVRAGAIDFLVKGSFDALLLSKVMRFARERFALLQELTVAKEEERRAREREARERELRILAEMADDEQRALHGGKLLMESNPEFFEKAQERYTRLLDIAVENRVYRERNPDFSRLLRQLVRDLGKKRASPRDLVELHSRALQHRIKAEAHASNQAHIDEGRILLLELMGYIIEFYRNPKALDHPGDPAAE